VKSGKCGKMIIEVIKDDDLWDKFIDNSTYGTLFHKTKFLNCVSTHFSYKLLKYGVYDNEELIGLIPMFYKKTYGAKMLFSPPPQTNIPYLGFVMNSDYDSLNQNKKESRLNNIVDVLNSEINNYSPNFIFISTVQFLDIRPFKWSGYIADPQYTYCLQLIDPIEQIWSKLSLRSCRRKIEAAEKEIILKKDNNVIPLYDLWKKRYEDQEINVGTPLQYFQDLMKSYPDNFDIYYLSKNDTYIGGQIVIKYKNKYILWVGNLKVSDIAGANEFLNWELIKNAKKEGYEIFELLGANTKRLCQFKTKFNPNLELYFNLYKKDFVGSIVQWAYKKFVKKRIF
jgi:hypothetical protein